jgi:hypothetical protein
LTVAGEGANIVANRKPTKTTPGSREDLLMKSDFLAGVLVGALVGAAVGILFAPEAGEETRERVKEGALKVKEAATERARGMIRRGEARGEQGDEGLSEPA